MGRRLNLDFGRVVQEFISLADALELKNKIYRRLFKGKGPEFDGFRMYNPDDDAADIDWKTSARAGKIVVKQYKEERKLSFFFIIDVGDGMIMGSQKYLKCEYAAHLAGAFMRLVYDVGDKAGLVMFGQNVKQFVPPSNRKNAYEILLDTMGDAIHYGGPSSFHNALKFFTSTISTSLAAVIIISDFTSYRPSDEVLLRSIASRFETMALVIRDPLDMTLPDLNEEFVIEDPMSGERILINPHVARAEYEKFAQAQLHSIKQSINHAGADSLLLDTSKPFPLPLAQFLEGRIARGAF